MELKSGVLLGKGKYDWVAGANSSLPDIVNVDDWKKYDIEHEIQFISNTLTPYDTLFCVTFSALKSLAKFFMFLLHNGYLHPEDVRWLVDNGYFKNGYINFNERFTGILGETTDKGAYQYKVANAIKNYGLIPQNDLPMASNFWDNLKKEDITEANYKKGKEFIERFLINYEWIYDYENKIKTKPIQTIVRFANYENPTNILKPDGSLNHAVVMVMSAPEYNEIDDTYYQRYKRYDKNYTHSYMGFHITITNKNMDIEKFVKDNDKKWVRNYNTGAFGRILQGKLFIGTSTDRMTLMLLDDKVRENGIQISDSEWKQLPKEDF
jgi:hypothetical protein